MLFVDLRDCFTKTNSTTTILPRWSDDEIYKLTCQYVAPIDVAGHPTGGAIDITLLENGTEVDMGTEFNDIPIEPENLTYLLPG